jgi:hypothetical protein
MNPEKRLFIGIDSILAELKKSHYVLEAIDDEGITFDIWFPLVVNGLGLLAIARINEEPLAVMTVGKGSSSIIFMGTPIDTTKIESKKHAESMREVIDRADHLLTEYVKVNGVGESVIINTDGMRFLENSLLDLSPTERM